MAQMQRSPRSGPPQGGAPTGRPGLVPPTSLALSTALLQVALLLGIPLALLLLARPVLRTYFPELGY